MDRRTLTGGLWSAAESLFRFGLQLALSIVLARLLTPTDFGIYAMTFIFFSLSQVLVDGGFSSALIQKQNTDQATETAVFHYNMLAAGVLAIGISAIAPLIARTYGYPVLAPLLYANAAILFLKSLGAVPGALLHKRREFAGIARLTIISSILGAVAGGGAAFLGAGIWTFVIQAAVSAIYSTAGIWLISTWRPRGRFDLRPARSLAGYGSLLALSGLLDVGYNSGYPLILGRLYEASDVGYFNRGQNVQANLSGMVTGVIQRVLFPTLAIRLEDKAGLKQATRRAVSMAMAVNAPAMLFLAFFSDLIIEVVYHAKWLPSAPVLTIMSLGGILYPLQVINLQVVLAHGNSRLFFRLEILKKLVGIAMVVVGCFYGLMGLAVSQLLLTIIAYFLNAAPAKQMINYSIGEQIRDIAASCTLSLVIMIALFGIERILPSSNPLKLLTLLVLAGATYLGMAMMLKIGPFREFLSLLKKRRILEPNQV